MLDRDLVFIEASNLTARRALENHVTDLIAVGLDRAASGAVISVTIAEDIAIVRWTYTWPGESARPRRELGCDIVTFSNGLMATKDAYRKVDGSHQARRDRAQGPSSVDFVIRPAVEDDCEALLPLMRDLAKFEGYIDRFAPEASDLRERISKPGASGEFEAVVAESLLNKLWGYCAFHLIPFTFDLRPTLIIKELFVMDSVRSTGVGEALFEAVVAIARARGCGRIKWDVLPDNSRAKAFYSRLGGHREQSWEAWTLDIEASAAPPS